MLASVQLNDTRSRPSTNSVELDEQFQNELLSALSDPQCRAILRATAGRRRTAAELAEELDLPLSTTYRKLDRLTDASLVEETCRLAFDGKHAQQYRCAVEEIHIELSEVDQELLTVEHDRRVSTATSSSTTDDHG